ncbi:MAG TPA: histidinol-phosphate transaminase [Candidatus Saccharimonadales bacterium]|nr:histidinol-phosphate transaminase [Candidatus Saccharimonadales bacterium]
MKIKLPVRKAILERRTYEAPAENRRGKIRLDFNENTTGCSAEALKAIRRLTAKDVATYPEYDKSTRELAGYFGVKPAELLLTNGGDDALRVFFDTFVEPGTHILICEPTFPMYRYYAEIAGARVETLQYGRKMEFPLAAALVALKKKPRVFFLANPNNPTGTLVQQREIEQLLRAAGNTVVVLDEAYAEFSGTHAIALTRKYPHLFIARTFSKAAGLAGLRLGAVIANTGSLALVRRAMPPYPVNTAALVAATAATKQGKDIADYVSATKRRREWFAGELGKHGVRVFPTAANFLLADFGAKGPVFFRKLARHNILIRERSKDLGPGFARITIGTQAELNKFLRILRQKD